MVCKTVNTDAYFSKNKYIGREFGVLRATFTSRYQSKIKKPEDVLQRDDVFVETKRNFLGKWKLTIKISITGKFDDYQYQRIIGKFFMAASNAMVSLETIGL